MAVLWEDSYVFTFRLGIISKLRVLTLFLVLAWTKNSGYWLWKLLCVCPFEKKETVAVYFGVDFQGRDTARLVSLPLNRRIQTKVCEEEHFMLETEERSKRQRCSAVESYHLRKSSKELLKWRQTISLRCLCYEREKEILETHFTVPLFLSSIEISTFVLELCL